MLDIIPTYDVFTGVDQAVEQSAGTIIPSLAAKPGGEPIAQAASEAFATAIRWTAFVAAAFVGLGLLATLKLPPEGGHQPGTGSDDALRAESEPVGRDEKNDERPDA